jgi:uncharacterized membrane protein YgdD (TMEM256/DUF423 family)
MHSLFSRWSWSPSLGFPLNVGWTGYVPLVPAPFPLWPTVAGWLFIAGVLLFSGSLYALAISGNERWSAVTPFGGVAFLLGWVALLIPILTS